LALGGPAVAPGPWSSCSHCECRGRAADGRQGWMYRQSRVVGVHQFWHCHGLTSRGHRWGMSPVPCLALSHTHWRRFPCSPPGLLAVIVVMDDCKPCPLSTQASDGRMQAGLWDPSLNSYQKALGRLRSDCPLKFSEEPTLKLTFKESLILHLRLLGSPLLVPICMPKEISLSRSSYNCNVPLNLNVPPFFKIVSTGGLYRGPLNRSQKMEA